MPFSGKKSTNCAAPRAWRPEKAWKKPVPKGYPVQFPLCNILEMMDL